MRTTLIIRKATQNDLRQLEENHFKEKEAYKICQEKISEHKLPMNLISAEYTFDLSKIIFSFTADGRVDFRDLVKDLAYIFHTRIELRQVGVRDEAKLLGGMGCCGRSLCCSTFLGDFVPVSIRMAKDQNLSLNPAKISGICGRLMCCLKYENDLYCEAGSNEIVPVKEPILYMRVIVDEGEGKVISINRQRKTATIILDNSKTVIASWDNMFEAESNYNYGGEVKTVNAAVEEEIIEKEVIEEEENLSQRNNIKPQTKFSMTNTNEEPRERKNFKNNKKYQRNVRRNEDYQQNRKHNPRRPNFDDD